MKRLRLLWMGVLLVLAGCGAATTTYSGEFGGLNVSFEYPMDWIINAEPGTLAVTSDLALLDDSASDLNGSVVRLVSIPVSSLVTVDLQQLLTGEMASLRQFAAAQIVEEATAVEINGRAGYTAVLRSANTVYKLAMLETDTNILFVLGEVRAADITEETLSQIDSLIDTITVSELLQ